MTQPLHSHPSLGTAPTAGQLLFSMQKVNGTLPPKPLVPCSFGGIW